MRSAFDKLISWTGVAMAGVLLVAGGLLTWAHNFIGDQVNEQLTNQAITMPEGDALASLPKADAEALKPYAGSALDTGPEAKAFANHYIAAHMDAMAGGKTYEEVSGEYIQMSDEQKASDEGQALAGLRQSMFMGNTLRGLLLYGYAFATIGTIAGIAAWAAFGGATLIIILVALGMRHARRAKQKEAFKAPAASSRLAPA